MFGEIGGRRSLVRGKLRVLVQVEVERVSVGIDAISLFREIALGQSSAGEQQEDDKMGPKHK